MDYSAIREHMEVTGSDGQHVGTVDKVENGARIKLTRKDPAAGGEHHYLPLDLVSSVGETVQLSVRAAQAMQQWGAA